MSHRSLAWLAVCAGLFIGCARPPDTQGDGQMPLRPAGSDLHVEVAGELVTVIARDVPLDHLLAELARQDGFVLVLAEAPDERVTVELRRIPLSTAMSRILRDRSFIYTSRKPYRDTLWVFSKPRRDDEALASASRAVGGQASVQADGFSELAQTGGAHAIAILTAAALGDGDASIREEAIAGLASIRDETAIPVLEQALSDSEYHVREAAVAALADIGGNASALALAGALKDPNASLREDAVDALGEIGGETATRLLQRATQDERSSIREAAAEYLVELSEQARRR